jgi:hypothetical protein
MGSIKQFGQAWRIPTLGRQRPAWITYYTAILCLQNKQLQKKTSLVRCWDVPCPSMGGRPYKGPLALPSLLRPSPQQVLVPFPSTPVTSAGPGPEKEPGNAVQGDGPQTLLSLFLL